VQTELPRRKHPRLKGYDYSSAGYYFITICTFARQPIFACTSVGAIQESPEANQPFILYQSSAGDIVERVLLEIPNRYPSVKIDKYVIMPNHIHLIAVVSEEERTVREPSLHVGKRSLISKMVGYLKMNVSKEVRTKDSNLVHVWQKSYHDRIIRSEVEYQRIWQYIDENMLKWHEDCYFTGE
jgi:REP element-mobilizing transposase RayT